jgi:hypothetical protein
MAGTLAAGVQRSLLDLGSPSARTVLAAPRLPDLTDRLFSDFGGMDAMSLEDSHDAFDTVEHESYGAAATLQRQTASMSTLRRVDEDDADWLATRDEETDAIDEVFADLFGEDVD